MDTLEALMAIHSTEGRLFCRMMEMNMDSDLSRKTMAYWMYLESEGFKDLLEKIASHDDKFLALVCLEAQTILSSFHPNLDTPFSSICGPLTRNLVRPTLTVLESLCSSGGRERVTKGVFDLYDGVCSMVFEDILEERGLSRRGVEEGKGVTVADIVGELVKSTGGGECASAKETEAGGGDVGKVKGLDQPPYSGSKLNPNAKEWYPSPEQVPEEDRCLYLTFSNGSPLSHNQIYRLFTKKFGQCVDRVFVHQPCNGPPLFGKVVFNRACMPVRVLGGKEETKFIIDGKTLLCKKYRPKNKHNVNDEGKTK